MEQAGASGAGADHVTVGIIGLGTIAAVHLEVLATLPGWRVVFGVDPGDPAAVTPPGVPVLGSLDEALARCPDVDLVVVATPTPTHVGLVSQALAGSSARVLSEKPLSDDPADLVALERDHGRETLERRLRVTNHFAFAPEVLWAGEWLAEHPELGVPTRVVSSFNDAYAGRPPEQLASYVSSWVDSASNQLGLLSRFVTGFEVLGREEADGGQRCAARVAYDGGEAVLVSNWRAAETSKQTSLHFADGVEVRMDHTSMTVLVVDGGRVLAHRAYPGGLGRKAARYDGLYREMQAGQEGRPAGYALARELARLLAAPAADAAATRWS